MFHMSFKIDCIALVSLLSLLGSIVEWIDGSIDSKTDLMQTFTDSHNISLSFPFLYVVQINQMLILVLTMLMYGSGSDEPSLIYSR